MSWKSFHFSYIGRILVYAGCSLLLAQAIMWAGPGVKVACAQVTGCVPTGTVNYAGFGAGQFETMENISIANGKLVLNTGQQTVDPNRIVIPFTQEVFVYFIFEGTGYKSDLGWMLRSEANIAAGADGVISDKEFAAILASQKRILFRAIQDDRETGGCCSGGDGVLDIFYPTSNWTEAQIAAYNDGTNYRFVPNYDGVVDMRDMRKSLGVIAGGTEIVFFLKANGSDTDVYWNVINFNEDKYTNAQGYGFGTRTFELWRPNEGWNGMTSGWMAQPALDRLRQYFGITFRVGDTASYQLVRNEKPPHMIAAVPRQDPYAWIFTWEDLPFNLSSDLDSNDNVFYLLRRTSGTAQSVVIDSIPSGNTDTAITAVNIQVVELLPCEACAGKTRIQWYLTIDGGATWEEVSIWDQIIEPATCDVAGAPPKKRVTRSARVDFAAMNKTGNDLKWKAILQSEDDDCVPEVEDVDITYQATLKSLFSRSSPAVLANVLYTGSYETPSPEWIAEGGLRGHVHAIRLYNPANPSNAQESDVLTLWDTGEWLRDAHPDNSRRIKISDMTLIDVVDEPLEDQFGAAYLGDGTTRRFMGTLDHGKLQSGTLTITDGTERFTTTGPSTLAGDRGGTGAFNRFTGEYDVTFYNPPVQGVNITATYRYYSYTQSLLEFDFANATDAKLGLDNSRYIDATGEHYTWDLERDGDFDENDRLALIKWARGWRRTDPVTSGYLASDYNASNKWKLGPIDHSAPAVIGPPGEPEWFNGAGISEQERVEFVTWRNSPGIADRPTMLYVGARDGMLHAFYAGQYRHGDNRQMADPSDPCSSQMPSELANIEEFRGYFKWEPPACTPNYGTGEERWAFIPSNILSRLKYNFKATGDQGYVDASPAVADVKIGADWRTVLVCAEGNGGDTIFALDVTNPYNVENVKFLWEFYDPDIYRSKSSPAVGRLWVNGQQKWVAFFTSGKSQDPSKFGSIFVVDIITGNLIKRVYLDAAGEPARGNSPSGTPSIVDGDRNGFMDRFYVGDDKGYMYRVNLFPNGSDNPDNWTSCVLANVQQPIYASPAVLVNNETDVEVFFGTGDDPTLDDAGPAAQYIFWAIHDRGNNNQCITKFDSRQAGIDLAASGGASQVWYYVLPPGHRIWASAFAAAARVYFATTTTETEDPCALNPTPGLTGAVFALERSTGALAASMSVGNVFSSPIVEDEHLYVKPANPEGWPTKKGVTMIGDTQFNNPMRGGQRVKIKSWREILP